MRLSKSRCPATGIFAATSGTSCGESIGRQGVVVLREVYVFPLAVHDFLADLRGGLSLLRFRVGKDRFLLAQHAMRAVIIREAIEQALVADFLIATAITRLLIEEVFFFGGSRVNVSRFCVQELAGVECLRERPFGCVRVIGRDIGLAIRRGAHWRFRLSRRTDRRCAWSRGTLGVQRTCTKPSKSKPQNCANNQKFSEHRISPCSGASVGRRPDFVCHPRSYHLPASSKPVIPGQRGIFDKGLVSLHPEAKE